MAKILVVDDDDQLLRVFMAVLVGAGHEVSGASDGKEALAALREQPADVLVTDVLMPERDGLALLMDLRGGPSRPAVVAMSGGGIGLPADYLGVAEKLGAGATLQKPFSGSELLHAVDRALAAN